MRTAKTTAVILSACIFLQVSAQENEDKLFKDIKPLDIALKVSIKEVKDNTGDTLWESDVLHYRNEHGAFDSVKNYFDLFVAVHAWCRRSQLSTCY